MESARQGGWVRLGVGGLLLLALWTKSGLFLMVAIMLGVVALVVTLWGRYGLARVEYQRSFSRARCFVGEELEVTLVLTNRKVLPLASLILEESVPEYLNLEGQKLVFHRKGRERLGLLYTLSWYQRVIRRYKVKPIRRGYYRLGPAVIRTGDPFGWVERAVEVAESDLLLVYPRVLTLEQVGLPARRPFGDLTSWDRLFEDPLRFAGLREYRPGDPLNRIHWKASASTGHLQVRLLDPSASMGLAVFLNTWSFDRFWEGDDQASLEAGVTLAATVVNWAVNEGLAAGLYANGLVYQWGFNLRLPPARGDQVLTQALEGLARLRTGSPQPIGDLLAAEVPALPYGTSVVIITRSVNDDLAAAILRVQRSGRPVTLILTSDEAENVPTLPGVRLYAVGGEEGLHAAVLAP